MSEWIGWHWLRDDHCLNYRPHTRVEVGQTLGDPRDEDGEPGPLVLCSRGYHASRSPLDALRHAPGAIACRVRLAGEILEGNDKACAAERTCVAMVDATSLLHEFACRCAESALVRKRDAGHEPDARSWKAIEVKRAWLRGEATDEDLAAAADAAAAAVGDATWAAAASAARAATWDATWAAAGAAAWAAAWDEQARWLEEMLLGLLDSTPEASP